MGEAKKTQAQLLQEIAVLRQRLAQLEAEPPGREAAGQQQRMQSEARLHAILETVVDGIITINTHERRLIWGHSSKPGLRK